MLLAGWQYYGYEKLEFTFVGESTCSDSWVSTILTGKPKVSIPSFADRTVAGLKDDELVISMKAVDLERAVNGEYEFTGMMVERFAGYHRQSYGGCKVVLGAAAVGYRTESMHGAGSPQAQRIMIARQGNIQEKKKLAKNIAGIQK